MFLVWNFKNQAKACLRIKLLSCHSSIKWNAEVHPGFLKVGGTFGGHVNACSTDNRYTYVVRLWYLCHTTACL